MDDFISHRKEFERELEKALERTLEAVGEFVQGEAGDELERSPRHVKWGRLKGSIDYYVDMDKNDTAVYIGTNVHYAIYVHEGTGIYHPNGRRTKWYFKSEYDGKWHATRGMPPNRFLKNGLVRNMKQIEQYFKDNLKF